MNNQRKFKIEITEEQSQMLFDAVLAKRTNIEEFFRKNIMLDQKVSADKYMNELLKLLEIINVRNQK